MALAALLRSQPAGPFWAREWLDSVLSRHWSGYRGPGPRGWSLGSVLGNETLVQSRPTVRGANGRFLDDMLRTSAPCTISGFGWSENDSHLPIPSLALSRFRRFIGAIDPGPHEVDQDQLAADLPAFLLRARTDRSDRELVFLTYLKLLHARGALGSTYPEPEQIRAALSELRDVVGPELDVLLYDGRTLGVVHGRGTLLAFEPPPEPGRRRSPTGDNIPRNGLLIRVPKASSPEPVDGAERIAHGIFTIAPTRPLALVR